MTQKQFTQKLIIEMIKQGYAPTEDVISEAIRIANQVERMSVMAFIKRVYFKIIKYGKK